MARYTLPCGRHVLVDESDVGLIADLPWHSHAQSSSLCYARTTSGDARVMMHRLIMGASDGDIVDHINRNGLDNRRANLRFVTAQQSSCNRKSWGRSGVRGVRRKKNRWQAQITVNRQCLHLGYFDAIEDASAAYMAAAREHFGAFSAA